MYPTITFFYIYNSKTFELISFSTDETEMLCNLTNFKENPDFFFDSCIAPDLILSSVSYEDRDVFSMSDWHDIIETHVICLNPSLDIIAHLQYLKRGLNKLHGFR